MANSNVVTREDLKNVFEALGEGSYGTRIDALEKRDYVIEQHIAQNSYGEWSWRKWNSGLVECWLYTSTSSLTWTQYANISPYALYYSNGWNFNLPFDLADTSYVINANCLTAGSNFGWVARGSKATSGFTLYIVRNGNAGSCYVDINVKGRWK